MNIEETNRGFEVISFRDHNGEECSLQQSSAVDIELPPPLDVPGASYVWLGCEHNAKPHMGHELSPRMHLDREQVKQLVTHLQAWLETGSFRY